MSTIGQTRVVLVLGFMSLLPVPAIAGPLDPNTFSSLGAFPSLAGAYSINTSASMAPTFTEPGGTTITGVYYQDSPGHTVAVFDFSSINMTSAQTITATGAVPLVLLSRSDATIGGTVNGNGSDVNFSLISGPGGGNTNGNPGPGAGQYFFANGSGGGFGGAGGSGGIYTTITGAMTPSTPGGSAYGNLLVALQGGSAGGQVSAAGGGIEIGANGLVHLLAGAVVEANGSSAGPFGSGNGGGSGGGLFFHGNNILIDPAALISVQGGNGGLTVTVGGPGGGSGGGGGGGGGGRIVFEDSSNSALYLYNSINVQGGLGGSPSTGTTNGMNGTFTTVGGLVITPEPSSFVMVATSIVIGLGCKLYRRRFSGGR